VKYKMNKKHTVGEEAVKRLMNPDTGQGIVDTQREADKEYFEEIKKCIANHTSWDKPFYILTIHKKEQLLENVVRRYFFARQSLPTPQWDQTVWRYDPKNGDLQFIWVLPDENTAKWLAGNPQQVYKEHGELLQFVMDFLNKKLYRFYHNKFHKGEPECTDLLDSPYSEQCSRAAEALSNAESTAPSPSKIITT